jgi:hypothetical protein
MLHDFQFRGESADRCCDPRGIVGRFGAVRGCRFLLRFATADESLMLRLLSLIPPGSGIYLAFGTFWPGFRMLGLMKGMPVSPTSGGAPFHLALRMRMMSRF